MTLSADLAQLATDIESATPRQSAPWQDDLDEDVINQLCRRAEQLAAENRTTRAHMRKPG